MTAFCGWFDGRGAATVPAGAGAADQARLVAMAAAAAPAGRPVGADGLHADVPLASFVHAGGLHAVHLHAPHGAVRDGVAVMLSEPVGLAGGAGDDRGGAAVPADADALAAAWPSDAETLLARLRGPFALAVAAAGRLLLAIDRAGVRPLYVLRRGGVLYFSTRLAALAHAAGSALDLDDQALFDYLYCHMVPSPGSVYRGVTKLLPGQYLRFDGDTPPVARFYWRMPYRDDNPAGFAELRRGFRDLLPLVVGAAAGDGDAVGCFLSGGTDSSTVAGTFRQLRGAAIPSYSIGFAAEGYDEMGYARIAAQHFGTAAREYYVTADDVVASVPLLAAYCDEPFANASIVPAYLCARLAAGEGIRLLLGGDGGDEIFGGNERYANQWVFELYGRAPAALRGLLDAIAGLPGARRLAPLRKAQSYIAQARIPLPDRLNSYNFLHRTPLGEIFTPDFLARVDTDAPLANLREVYQRTGSAAVVNRMMHLDLKITLADNDLRKVNQACELAGVAVRYPLLDDRMMAFAATVPPDMQLRRTQLRWFFKRALADFLPPEIIRKRKQGFGLPVGLWMREHAGLAELMQDSISDFRRRGIVRADYIDWVLRQHRDGHASYYGVMLWVLMTLERWLAARGR